MDLIAIEELIEEKRQIEVTPAVARLRAKWKSKKRELTPIDPKPSKTKQKQPFNYDDFYKIAGVKQHTQFEKYLYDIIFNREEREAFYNKFLELSPCLSTDSFREYFELYSAERKSFMQDYTPDSVTQLLSLFTRSDADTHGVGSKYTAYDATAGTGGMIIAKWNDDRIQETPWSYAPHRYFYRADEMADNVIPYLIHNLAMRGMNAIVVHGDVLTKQAKQVYFLQNSSDDFMAYSDINVMPHDENSTKEFMISEWLEPEIDHKESSEVKWNFNVLPMHRKRIESSASTPKFEAVIPWKDAPRLNQIAFVERAQKNKIYPKGSIIIQLSATRGQMGLLESDGLIDSHYAVITLHYNSGITPEYIFLWLQTSLKEWLHRVQEGLNVSLSDIETMPVFTSYKRTMKEIEYGQQALF